MNISGFATAEGTARYRARLEKQTAPGHFHEAEGLACSSLGIGTYLGRPDSATDGQVIHAVADAVAGGINVIDTAINYRSEHGERSVGAALTHLIETGTASRDELVLCTKGGFLPQSLGTDWFRTQFGSGQVPGIGLNDLAADCHCLHPAYLDDQLERSLANLHVDTVDLYYLHNPETQLGEVPAPLFEERLARAFGFLEKAAAAGRIRFYGLATWSAFRVPPGHPRHISLERVRQLARQAAGGEGGRFRFIQLPLNLRMPEALARPAQPVAGAALPALEAARRLGLNVMISGSIAQGEFAAGMTPPVRQALGADLDSDAQRALQFARSAPGVLSALVGMKQPRHVQENLRLCARPPLPAEAYPGLLRSLPEVD